MPTFNYEAFDQSGKPTKGVIDAASEEDVKLKLRSQGLRPTAIRAKENQQKKAAVASGGIERKKTFVIGGVSGKQLTLFTRQFATLIDAGLPMVRSLDILEEMLPPGALKNAVMDLKDEVTQGSSLSESLAKCPKAFDELYVNMIRAGESSGMLSNILNRLADFREKSERLQKAIMSALIYPAAVLTIAGLILAVILIWIVPKFKEMFDNMGIEMPGVTQLLMTITDTLVNNVWLVFIGPAGVVGFFWLVRQFKQGRYFFDAASLYLPIFGLILKKTAISRLCRTLGELSNAGVPILDALSILKSAVGNAVVADAVADIHASIREGDTIAEPMRRSGIFDLMVVNMVAVGEETGELDKMLIKIADNYDNDVDSLVKSLMSLLEPFLMVGMGIVVGFIVIALFMPMISLLGGMSN